MGKCVEVSHGSAVLGRSCDAQARAGGACGRGRILAGRPRWACARRGSCCRQIGSNKREPSNARSIPRSLIFSRIFACQNCVFDTCSKFQESPPSPVRCCTLEKKLDNVFWREKIKPVPGFTVRALGKIWGSERSSGSHRRSPPHGTAVRRLRRPAVLRMPPWTPSWAAPRGAREEKESESAQPQSRQDVTQVSCGRRGP